MDNLECGSWWWSMTSMRHRRIIHVPCSRGRWRTLRLKAWRSRISNGFPSHSSRAPRRVAHQISCAIDKHCGCWSRRAIKPSLSRQAGWTINIHRLTGKIPQPLRGQIVETTTRPTQSSGSCRRRRTTPHIESRFVDGWWSLTSEGWVSRHIGILHGHIVIAQWPRRLVGINTAATVRSRRWQGQRLLRGCVVRFAEPGTLRGQRCASARTCIMFNQV